MADVTRELLKANDGVNLAAFKELIHVFKYILGTKKLDVKIKPKGNVSKHSEIVWFSNCDYAGEPVNRISISSFIRYVLRVLVFWWSKSQKSISLSSSEMEYIAISETVEEVMLVTSFLGSMKISVEYPVMVRVDNIGAIFVVSIIATTHTPSLWISGTSLLMSMLRMELLR